MAYDPNTVEGEAVNNNDFNDYYGMLDKASSQWGLEPSQVEDYMNRIAFHESKYGTDKYTPVQVSDISETGYGPGRGMFQFETGKGQGGETAAIRLERILGQMGKEIPDWLNVTDEGFDASQLTDEQQKMLFLGNYMGKPNPEGWEDNPDLMSAGLSGVTSENLPEWWAQHHWAGDAEEKAGKLDRFSGDMNVYGI